MSNLHEASDDDLQQLADIAERQNDWRSYNAALVEIQRRQDTVTRRADMDIIRDVAARYSPEWLRR